MNKKLTDTYLIPTLVSITLGVAVMAITLEREPLAIVLIFLSSFLGQFLLDADYYIHAKFVDPTAEFSKSLIAYVKHKDILGSLVFAHIHKNEVKERTLNSAIFQVVFALATAFVCSTSTGVYLKAFVLSVLANSIYRFAEEYYTNDVSDWFWGTKFKVTDTNVKIYISVLVLWLAFCVTML